MRIDVLIFLSSAVLWFGTACLVLQKYYTIIENNKNNNQIRIHSNRFAEIRILQPKPSHNGERHRNHNNLMVRKPFSMKLFFGHSTKLVVMTIDT